VRGAIYIGAWGHGASQWESITRIVGGEPSDAFARTADAWGGRGSQVRDPEAARGGGGGVAREGSFRFVCAVPRRQTRAQSGNRRIGDVSLVWTTCQCLAF